MVGIQGPQRSHQAHFLSNVAAVTLLASPLLLSGVSEHPRGSPGAPSGPAGSLPPGGGCSGSTLRSPASPRPALLQHRPCWTLKPLAERPAGTGDSLSLCLCLAGPRPDGGRPGMLRVLPTLRLPRGVHAPKTTHARAHTHTSLDSSLPRKGAVQSSTGEGTPR